MKIEICSEFYKKELLKANPEKIFVFGDNVKRYGKGGQAIIRDEPNAFGIATKNYPSREPWAYFSDHEVEIDLMLADLRSLYKLAQTNVIVFPAGGIGTGLSSMQNKSPKAFDLLNKVLYKHFGFKNELSH